MTESWEETKARLQKQGIGAKKELPTVKQVAPKKERSPLSLKLFNIHKRSLPIGIDQPVVFSVTKEEAKWWIEYKLKSKCYENAADDSKTVIYYDIVPVNATPKERSIYYNTTPVTKDKTLFNGPKRIN